MLPPTEGTGPKHIARQVEVSHERGRGEKGSLGKPATYQILLIGRPWGQPTPCWGWGWGCVTNILVQTDSGDSPQVLEIKETGVSIQRAINVSGDCTPFYTYTRQSSPRKL